jgi:hypothetical protein
VNREPEVGSGTCGDEELRIAVGALALGALDPDEARAVRQHLAECPECQAEYTSFVGVKRVMDIGLVGAPMPELVEPARPGKRSRFQAPARAPFRTPLRRRMAVAAAGCAAALALVVGGFWAGHTGTPTKAATTISATALPAVTQSGVTAQISYQGEGWGTWVNARMSGTPAGLTCTLYVIDKHNVAVPMSSWKSVAGKVVDIPATTALAPGQIDHFQVRVDDFGYDIVVPMTS